MAEGPDHGEGPQPRCAHPWSSEHTHPWVKASPALLRVPAIPPCTDGFRAAVLTKHKQVSTWIHSIFGEFPPSGVLRGPDADRGGVLRAQEGPYPAAAVSWPRGCAPAPGWDGEKGPEFWFFPGARVLLDLDVFFSLL